jgi:hypothetical protein
MGVLAAPGDPGASADLTRSSLPIRPPRARPLALRTIRTDRPAGSLRLPDEWQTSRRQTPLLCSSPPTQWCVTNPNAVESGQASASSSDWSVHQ